MQNLILLMDASGKDYVTPQKSGNSFMNRFSVGEDAAFEIIGIHHLETQQSLPENQVEDQNAAWPIYDPIGPKFGQLDPNSAEDFLDSLLTFNKVTEQVFENSKILQNSGIKIESHQVQSKKGTEII